MAACAVVSSVPRYAVTTLLLVASLVRGDIKCDCSINGVTYSLVGITCARPNATEDPERTVQCARARYGALEAGYGVDTSQKGVGYSSLYRLYRTSRQWEQAAQSCERDGGHLAVPDTQQELEYLAKHLRRQGNGRTNAALLGLRKDPTTGAYISVTGKQLSALLTGNWAAGEPYSVPGQQCLEMQVTESSRFVLRSRYCGNPGAYFCERSLNPPVPANYHFVPGVGFYMPSSTFLPYAQMEQQCLRTGGHIVVPDTQQEADALMKGMDLFPKVEKIYVGFDDRRQAGVFETIHGGRLSWLEFQNWSPGALESRSADVHCVVFTSAGSYQLVHCDTRLPTICEWPLG